MLPSTVAVLTALLVVSPPTFTGTSSLSVRVVGTQGDAGAGATLQLCPLPDSYMPRMGLMAESESCAELSADKAGRAVFQDVPEGRYSLVAALDGFARTALFPLPIGSRSPVAPDEVVVMLNPVCFDCVSVENED